MKDTKKNLLTLALETLTTKCKKDIYEELIDFNLTGKCCDGQLLQSCATSSEFICNYGLEREYSRHEEIKITNLSPYCLIGAFLQSCDHKNYFLCECKNGGIILRRILFVTFVYLTEI